MSIRVKLIVKRTNEEIDEPIICPEAMNDPDNLAMRKTKKEEKKFVKDYDTIKKELDKVMNRIDSLMDDYNHPNYWDNLKMLSNFATVLKWVLDEGKSDL